MDASLTKEKKTAVIGDATLSPAVASPGDTVVINVKLQPFREEPITKEIFFTVPKDQPYGEVTLEVRGGGVVPLPYLWKTKVQLTDELIRRLKTYKDFDEFYKELRNTDTNNQIVVEILEDGVSMVEDGEKPIRKALKLMWPMRLKFRVLYRRAKRRKTFRALTTKMTKNRIRLKSIRNTLSAATVNSY